MADKLARTEIILSEGAGKDEARIVISGAATGVVSDPAKLQQLLELLGLPSGASARILYTTDDVVVR
jgi:hypothetical protein